MNDWSYELYSAIARSRLSLMLVTLQSSADRSSRAASGGNRPLTLERQAASGSDSGRTAIALTYQGRSPGSAGEAAEV